MTELAEIVAEMRALGVQEYERGEVRVKLGPAPLPPSEDVERPTQQAIEELAELPVRKTLHMSQPPKFEPATEIT